MKYKLAFYLKAWSDISANIQTGSVLQ